MTTTPQELIKEAQSQGATNYDPRTKTFWRTVRGQLEIASSVNGELGNWRKDWRAYPPESSVRI